MASEIDGVHFEPESQALLAMQPELIWTSAINNEKIEIIKMCEEYGVYVMADKPIYTLRKMVIEGEWEN